MLLDANIITDVCNLQTFQQHFLGGVGKGWGKFFKMLNY